ncbi:AraC-type DNA-binding protein [Agreia bicolorata]|uniref:AraC-type DNA-binding protein n=1 Tax=Agreia bicolorata TaxID=110935 RepID=A0A1T4WRT8_9MICO|nr:AraC family transcriptional regulator [Agreia bicolorata]SKA79575.1 AraC-type DNA-binding protein [Agreia bicolorata]
MAVDSDSLSKVLSSIDLRVGVGRRVALEVGAPLRLPADATTLVYVLAGRVRGNPPRESGCRLDIDEGVRRVHVTTERDQAQLVEGDAFLTLGTTPLTLEAETGATLMVLELEFADTMPPLGSLFPEFVTITAFGALEPAAAALATNMGVLDPAVCPMKSGDPVICRMMAATLLLTLIRAWAANDCAPEGWPSLSTDPFLDRVVDAIHDEPGREWTVESLANVAVMSRSAFAARFRAVLGQSPANYVTDVRMVAAKRMLDAGRSVSETSRELGYASDEGFSRAFRRNSGVTPSAWRMAHSISVSA